MTEIGLRTVQRIIKNWKDSRKPSPFKKKCGEGKKPLGWSLMWSDESRFALFQRDGHIRGRWEADDVMLHPVAASGGSCSSSFFHQWWVFVPDDTARIYRAHIVTTGSDSSSSVLDQPPLSRPEPLENLGWVTAQLPHHQYKIMLKNQCKTGQNPVPWIKVKGPGLLLRAQLRQLWPSVFSGLMSPALHTWIWEHSAILPSLWALSGWVVEGKWTFWGPPRHIGQCLSLG